MENLGGTLVEVKREPVMDTDTNGSSDRAVSFDNSAGASMGHVGVTKVDAKFEGESEMDVDNDTEPDNSHDQRSSGSVADGNDSSDEEEVDDRSDPTVLTDPPVTAWCSSEPGQRPDTARGLLCGPGSATFCSHPPQKRECCASWGTITRGRSKLNHS